MISVPSIDKYKMSVMIDLESVARLKMLVKGKMVKATPKHGCNVRKPMIALTVQKYIEHLVTEAVKDVQMDAECRKWMYEQQKRMIAKRDKVDAKMKAGINRKPPETLQKCGRKAGKVYPASSYPNPQNAGNERRRKALRESWKRALQKPLPQE